MKTVEKEFKKIQRKKVAKKDQNLKKTQRQVESTKQDEEYLDYFKKTKIGVSGFS